MNGEEGGTEPFKYFRNDFYSYFRKVSFDQSYNPQTTRVIKVFETLHRERLYICLSKRSFITLSCVWELLTHFRQKLYWKAVTTTIVGIL